MKNRSDIVGGCLLLLLGSGAILEANRLHVGSPTEPQPGFFPFLAGISLILLSSIIFLKGWFAHDQQRTVFGEVRRPVFMFVVMILLVAVLDRVGYLIGIFVASVFMLRILNVKSWRVLVFTSFCLSIGTYILFDKLLGIQLPMGILTPLGL